MNKLLPFKMELQSAMITNNVLQCYTCNKDFVTLRNLKRHEYEVHGKGPRLKCDKCDKSFKRRDRLFHHSLRHESVICTYCRNAFSTSSLLSEHLKISSCKEELDKMKKECDHCGIKISRKNNLIRHIISKHTISQPVEENNHYECAYCGLCVKVRSSLVRHMRRKHSLEISKCRSKIKYLECNYCGRKLTSKLFLRRHIKLKHPHYLQPFITLKKLTEKIEVMVCTQCGIKLESMYDALPHIKLEHDNFSVVGMTCAICKYVCRKLRKIFQHYKSVHDVKFVYENMNFRSIEKFEEWRKFMEQTSGTVFKIRNSRTLRSKIIQCRFSCYTAEVTNKVGFCPAELVIQMNDEDGLCDVRSQSQHVGHALRDGYEPSKLNLLYLKSAEEKQNSLATFDLSSVANEVTPYELFNVDENIVKNEYNDLSHGFIEDKSAILKKILENNANSIIYRKNRNEHSNDGMFEYQDYGFIIMSKYQEKILNNYGNNTIIIDNSSRITSTLGFVVLTLSVTNNAGNKIMPVAFIITNRCKPIKDAFVVLLSRLADRLRVFNPKTLISEPKPFYYKVWQRVIGSKPDLKYGMWHVLEDWKYNYCLIRNADLVKSIEKELEILIKETNKIVFQQLLDSFISNCNRDVENFLDYFHQHYSENIELWATCFKTMPIELNAEHFQSDLKDNIGRIRDEIDCLEFIFDYTDVMMHGERGESFDPVVRQKHLIACERISEKEFNGIVAIDSNFLVSSFSRDNEQPVYEVTKTTRSEIKLCSMNCELVCDLCELCLHEFQCTCDDSKNLYVMCKHIHLVGLFLNRSQQKKQSPEFYDDNPDIFFNTIENEIIDTEMLDNFVEEETIDEKFINNSDNPMDDSSYIEIDEIVVEEDRNMLLDKILTEFQELAVGFDVSSEVSTMDLVKLYEEIRKTFKVKRN